MNIHAPAENGSLLLNIDGPVDAEWRKMAADPDGTDGDGDGTDGDGDGTDGTDGDETDGDGDGTDGTDSDGTDGVH